MNISEEYLKIIYDKIEILNIQYPEKNYYYVRCYINDDGEFDLYCYPQINLNGENTDYENNYYVFDRNKAIY